MNIKNSSRSERDMINKSGIILGDELKIKSSMDKAVPFYIHGIQILLIVGMVICPIISFLKCFNIQFNYFLVVLFSIVTVILEYLFIYQMKIFDRKEPFIVMVFIYILGISIQIKAIARGFITILTKYVEYINSYFDKEYIVNIKVNDSSLDVSKLVIAIVIVVSIVLTYYVIVGMNSVVYYLCTGVWIVLCYAVGCEPRGIYLMGYLGITIIVICINKVLKKYKISSEDMGKGLRQRKFREIAAIKVCITMAIVICISYGIFNIIYSKQKFLETNVVKNLNVAMNDIVGIIYYGDPDGKKISDNIKDRLDIKNIFEKKDVLINGKIAKTGEVHFEKKDIMTVVTSSITSDLYLKNYIGFDYDWGWVTKDKSKRDIDKLSIDENSYTNIASEAEYLFEDKLLEHEYVYIKDRKNVENKDLIPIAPSLNYFINRDGSLEYDTKEKDYAVGTYTAEFSQIYKFLDHIYDAEHESNYSSEAIKAYDEVCKLYVKVPKELQDVCGRLKPEIVNYAKGLKYGNIDDISDDNLTQLDYLCGLIYYLKRNYKYTLSPGEVPQGVDPVDYFLTENKKGYCVYYAAAATALLRYMGVPTRYVEGYVISYEDQEKAMKVDNEEYLKKLRVEKNTEHNDDFDEVPLYEYNIKDSNGHAWIEVYFKGIGWVPVEVTSSSGVLQDIELLNNEHDMENQISSTKQPENTDNKENQTPVPQVDNDEKNNQSDNQNKEPQATNNSNKQDTKETQNSKDTVEKNNNKIYVIIMVSLLTIIFGIVCIICRKYKKHVDKYEKLIKDDVVKYMVETINYIFDKEGIVFSSNIDYEQYAKQIASRYEQYSYKEVMEILEILLKKQYSSEKLENSEIQLCRQFFNSVVEDYMRQLKPKEQVYECKIKNYIKKV